MLNSDEEQTSSHRAAERQFAAGGGIAAVGQFADRALSLAFVVVVARLLGRAQLGLYAIGISIVELLGLLASLGLANGAMRFVAMARSAGDWRRVRKVVTCAVTLAPLYGAAGAVSLWMAAPWLADAVLHKPVVDVLRLFALTLPVLVALASWSGALQGLSRITHKVLVERITVPAVRLALAVIAVSLGLKVVGVVAAHVVACAVGALVALLLLGRCGERILEPLWDRQVHRELLAYSVPAMFATLLGMLLTRSGMLMLGMFAESGDVGVYLVVLRTASVGMLLPGALLTSLSPIMAGLLHTDSAAAQRLYKTALDWFVTVSLPYYAILFMFPHTVLRVFGGEFTVGVPALVILTAGWAIHMLTGPVGVMIMLSGRPGIEMINAAVCLAVHIGLNLLWIPRWQAVGAAASCVIALTAANAIRLGVNVWVLRLNPLSAVLAKRIVVAGVCLAPAAGLAAMLAHLLAWPAMLADGCGMITYVLLYCFITWQWRDESSTRLIAQIAQLPRGETLTAAGMGATASRMTGNPAGQENSD